MAHMQPCMPPVRTFRADVPKRTALLHRVPPRSDYCRDSILGPSSKGPGYNCRPYCGDSALCALEMRVGWGWGALVATLRIPAAFQLHADIPSLKLHPKYC